MFEETAREKVDSIKMKNNKSVCLSVKEIGVVERALALGWRTCVRGPAL